MAEFLLPIVKTINAYLSDYILIVLLIGIGLFYTIRTRFVQVRCFKEAMKKADPVLLEPIMKVDVDVPDEYLGTVMGGLTSRRGILTGTETKAGGDQVIHAEVPLSEMFGYMTDLRGSTQGRGDFMMVFSHYAETPKNVADKIVGDRKKLAE